MVQVSCYLCFPKASWTFNTCVASRLTDSCQLTLIKVDEHRPIFLNSSKKLELRQNIDLEMASNTHEQSTNNPAESGSGTSSVALLGEGSSELPSNRNRDGNPRTGEVIETDPKTGKRRFWNLGKKKEDEKAKKKREAALANKPQTPSPSIPAIRPISPIQPPGVTNLVSTSTHPYGSPSSPGRNLPTSSPHIPSPASSQIFERNVQEDGPLVTTSPAIPGHITTENHIPPALDASTEAITNDHLDPDHVEIVTHAAHQPAAVTVTGAGGEVAGLSSEDDLVSRSEAEEPASTYATLDVNDVRRLSFISFADVMHAEHADHAGARETDHLSGTSSIAPMGSLNRSPSPVLSPVSSHGMGATPPTSGSPSFKGLESSPGRGAGGLVNQNPGHSPPTGGELTIETMRQALRKTGSGDLSGARSQPISAVGGDDGAVEQTLK